MKFAKLFILLVLVSLVFAACAPVTPNPASTNPTETAANQPPTPTPAEGKTLPPAAALAAQKMLAEKLNLSTAEIEIQKVEPVDWPNACLGAAAPDEFCAQVITPGFRVILAANGQTYEYHTDREGSQIRQAETGQASDQDLPGGVLSARQVLAQRLNAALKNIEVVSFEPVEWPNACLGLQQPPQSCAEVITPGYKVTFSVDGQQYTFHTDQDGGNVQLAGAPTPQNASQEADLVWEQTTDNVCARLEARAAADSLSVTYGPCAGPLMEGQIVDPDRAVQFQTLLATYAPFFGGTPAGTLQFKGQGAQQATEAEQRSIAEWASLVRMEAESGRSGASWGLALAWHREGGIVGVCQDLTIYQSGWAYATSCKGNSPKNLGSFRLTADQLARIYQWVDQYQGLEYMDAAPDTADAMNAHLVFSGKGQQTASQDTLQAMSDFAAQLYISGTR